MSDSPPPDERAQTGEWSGGWWDDLRTATLFLTRLPIARDLPAPEGALARAMRVFPLVGLAIGLFGAAVYAVAHGLGLPATLSALVSVGAIIALTGALHEDGLADMADGFGAGGGRERKLAIMRDSRTGVYGALALILSVAARIAALAALPAPVAAAALIAAHAISRAALPAAMWRETLARDDGLAVAAGRPRREAVLWSVGLGAAIALVALGPATGVVALAAAAAAAYAVLRLARRQIGGITGDVLGGVQQAAEIAVLLVVAARA